MQNNSQFLANALAHHQVGQLAEARALYGRILQTEPGNPDALHFLGLLACQLGQHDVGLGLMEQSIAAHPNATYYNNIGNMLGQNGRLADAIEAYRRAVALKPDYPEAHNNLGNALREARQPEAAVESCARAIAERPGYAEAHNNLGNAQQDMGELEAAAASYGEAIRLNPDYAEAHNNLGNALRAQDKTDDAIASYRTAVALKHDLRIAHHSLGLLLKARGEPEEAIRSLRHALDPTDADAHNSIGTVLRDIGDLDAALTHFDTAIALRPDFAEAHCNRGGVLRRQSRFEESVESCIRAIELAPTLAEAYNSLGIAYYGLDRLEAATLSYRHAIELDPNNADAFHNLGVVLLKHDKPYEALESCHKALELADVSAPMYISLGDILRALGDLDGAIDAYLKALPLDPDPVQTYNRLLFSLAGSAKFDTDTYLKHARRFGELMSMGVKPYAHKPSHDGSRLRVGIVSGDLRAHPAGIFLESVFRYVNPARVELIAYATYTLEDEVTARLKPHFSTWRVLDGLKTEEAARVIRDDNIDVLVDLSGHTAYTGLPIFAWKPAPVQVSYLGFFASTGSESIDYFLGDRYVLPPGEEAQFVEKPWRLPDSYLCFTPPVDDVKIGPLPMLANGGTVTFGCFGKLMKVSDEVVALWSRLLHAVPGSRLFLKSHGLDTKGAQLTTFRRFAAHGIDESRLILQGASRRVEYLSTYNQVDIVLSPFPYPGGTTTAEGLWMGVPVLCMKGDRFLTHICESLLQTANLADWIAVDEEDYLARAIAFASDPSMLAAMRAGLREHVLASPLCDAPRFARNLEDAFHGMWKQYADDVMATTLATD
ncbi:tetratricopeptide repeat protein [Paraburkholderia gardini]|uniref:tetratricopeptide repeat protein n=1 Tax=Paraburkholderia gardini TaxID=2823469 RepID=UPI001D8CE83E|nr:tetratricopeptide repeat protein [Paraburkholderia gardini]CAG4910236.1 Photosystem I assembly protein Ycf3 [Paraburkholderia gardini]